MNQPSLRRSGALALLFALIIPLLVACGGSTPTGGQAADPTTATGGETSAPTTVAEPTTAAELPAVTEVAPTTVAGSENVLRIAGVAWPDSMDPSKISNASEIAVLQLAYEGLTMLDKDLKTVPASAESWEYNDDATEITFNLREGLKYADGSPLTAQAFVDAVYRSLDPRAPGNYQTTFDMVEGADAVINASPDDAAAIEAAFKGLGATAPDEQTITFKLTRPTPFFHTLVTMWVIFPAKQELVEAGGETWYESAENQVGNGPFKFVTIDRASNTIEYAANENYWRGRPKLDGVKMTIIEDLAVGLQAYKNGEVDVIIPDPNDVPTLKADPALSKEYVEYAGSCTEAYELNLTLPPFDNKAVREAFAYGFDRTSYIRDALKDTSVEALAWIPPGYPGYDESIKDYAYNPEQGKAKLVEAGFPEGAGLPEVKITYNGSNPANQARIEYLIQMYQQSLGITLVPDPVEATTLVNLRKDVATHPQINGGGWCADYPDPQNWLSVYWHSRTQFAATWGYSNPEVDALLDQADVETDEAKRAELYSQAQKMIVADVPTLIRSNSKNFFMVKPYVQGIERTPQDSLYPGQQLSLFNVTIAQ